MFFQHIQLMNQHNQKMEAQSQAHQQQLEIRVEQLTYHNEHIQEELILYDQPVTNLLLLTIFTIKDNWSSWNPDEDYEDTIRTGLETQPNNLGK